MTAFTGSSWTWSARPWPAERHMAATAYAHADYHRRRAPLTALVSRQQEKSMIATHRAAQSVFENCHG